jgi:predicted O-linked N-acetylglucosamine transferase (SPINDLY family)
LRRALQLRPDEADFLSNLGVALHESGDTAEGEATLRRSIALKPDIPEPHLHLSRALRESARHAEALAQAQRAVELAPQSANMAVNLGLTLAAAGADADLPAAEAACRRAIALDANSHLAHSGLGSILIKSNRYDEAAAAYTRALQIQPNFASAHSGLAAASHNLARYDDAIAGFRRAIELSPRDHGSYAGLGLSLLAAGRAEESLEQTRRALELKPDWPEYLNNLAVALEELGRFDEASDVLRRAVSLPPPHAHAENNLGKRLSAAGLVEEAVAHFRRACELSPGEANIRSNMLLSMHYLPDVAPDEMFAEHVAWREKHAKSSAKPQAAKTRFENERTIDRGLRIGYVSPDFAAHSVADFLEPLLEHHDHSRFEIFCYADVPRPDAYTHRLRQFADVWTDIANLKDARVAEMIRAHCIDILVDLAGHTARNRMPVFALKPAPVQVTYLGYPDTTGLPTIDWRITDAIADPPGVTEPYYTEALLRLPRTFLCYRPFPEAPAVGPLPADRSGGRVTFASFNNLSKLTPRVIEVWSQVLKAVPDARLLIKAAGVEGSPRERLIGEFARHGIAADRLELVGRIADLAQHFGKYNDVDIALDTFPYCGTTTTCEAMWMGVPVVTLVGRTHMSRVGLSLLTQVGLTDLSAETVEQYVATATALANDLPRLRELRAGMRERMLSSPLLDGVGVTRELEMAFRQIWAKWVASS